MNTMLSVVVMVFLVATTVGSVEVQEFSEEAFSALQLFDPKTGTRAKLINANDKVQLKIKDRQTDIAATFLLDHDKKQKDNYKIKLNGDEERFFDVIVFGILLHTDKIREGPITITLVVDPDDNDRILFHIPVFTAPSEVSTLEKTNPLLWQKWVDDNDVGFFSSMDKQALETAINTGKIKFNLKWLKELLYYKIYPKEITDYQGPKKTQKFVTRPIVVSEEMKNVLVKNVNKPKSRSWRSTFSC